MTAAPHRLRRDPARSIWVDRQRLAGLVGAAPRAVRRVSGWRYAVVAAWLAAWLAAASLLHWGALLAGLAAWYMLFERIWAVSPGAVWAPRKVLAEGRLGWGKPDSRAANLDHLLMDRTGAVARLELDGARWLPLTAELLTQRLGSTRRSLIEAVDGRQAASRLVDAWRKRSAAEHLQLLRDRGLPAEVRLGVLDRLRELIPREDLRKALDGLLRAADPAVREAARQALALPGRERGGLTIEMDNGGELSEPDEDDALL